MQKVLLGLAIATIFSMQAYAQLNTVIQAPPTSNGTTQVRAPNGLASHTSLRAHFVITAAELAVLPSSTNLTVFGFTLVDGVSFGANGTFKVYLEATSDLTNLKSTNWNSAISTMTQVYNGTYTIPVGAAATTVDMVLTTPFAYTGTGLYVAYEYIANTTDTDPATYNSNTTIAGAVKMISNTTTTPDSILTLSSSFRPCVRLGYPNPYSNDISIEALLDRNGKVNAALQTTQTIKVLVKNASNTSVSNVNVSINMTGANTYSASQTITSMTAGASQQIDFAGVPTTSTGLQNGTITVPNDDNNSNNTLTISQTISCDSLAFYNTDTTTNAIGFGTGTGCLANRHAIPVGTPTKVTGVGVVLSDETALSGNQIKGMLFNSLGQPIDSSAAVTIVSTMLGTRLQMNFLHANTDVSGQTVYVGFRQSANAFNAYYPLSTQADPNATPSRYYSLGVYGGNLTAYTTFGVFMIDAIVEPKVDLESNINGILVCEGDSVIYSTTSGYTNYEYFIDGVSATSGSSSSYTFGPIDTHVVLVQVMANACVAVDSLEVAVQVLDTSEVAQSICEGETFVFNGLTLSQSGIYTETFASFIGCDSVVELDLTVHLIDSINNNVSICEAESYDFYGQVINVPGTYYKTFVSNISGCDSVRSIELTISDPVVNSFVDTACANEFYDFNGQQLNVPGVYIDTMQTTAGCDSVLILNLAIRTVDTEVLKNGSTATAVESSAEYQWLKCPSNAVVNFTKRSYTPQASGSYKVVVTVSGCSDTSDCVYLVGTGLEGVSSPFRMDVYPNPATNVVSVKCDVAFSKVLLIDLAGKRVSEYINQNTVGTASEFSVSNIASGTYLLTIQDDDGYLIGQRLLMINP
ncbi:MAG: T9SS type A sorting domain-containing protein [Flavobacteriales bacterium]